MYYGRGLNKVHNPYTILDSYDFYIKDVDKDSPYDLDRGTYLSIVTDYLVMLAEEIIDNAGIVKLPYRLGTFQVVKLHPSKSRNAKYSIDYALSNKYNKKVYHLNEHSGGAKYMFRWDKSICLVKNKSMYRFIPTRTNKRKMAYNIKNKTIDYFNGYDI